MGWRIRRWRRRGKWWRLRLTRAPAHTSPARIVITGAARRVGRATALAFAARGCALVLTYRNSREACLETAEEARRCGAPEVDTCALDFHAADSLSRFVTAALRTGPVDGVVHNASSFASAPFGSISETSALAQYQGDALGPLLLSQALAPSLRTAMARGTMIGGAGIVLFGDAHADSVPRRGYTAYLMAKAAAHALVRQLAVELAPEIRVNGIAPGVIAWPDDMPADARSAYLERVPLKRAGTPEEAAALAVFLLLDAHYSTGQIVQLDGGRNG